MILYYILDTEVTGLSVDVHEINQISVMRVQDQEQLSLQIKVKKPHVYNPGSLQIQGITYKDLKEGRPLEEAVDMIDCFLAEDGKTKAHRCIIAHNAPFDRKFVHRAWDSVNKEFPADLWMCTQSFGKRYVKKNANGEKIAKAQLAAGVEDMKKDKHGRLKAKFGLNNFMLGVGLDPRAGAHRAEIDVQNTLDLYNWLMKSGTEHVSLISRVPHKETPQHELDLDDF
jgi:DNA polymerase III epsilon subunit-like protein